MATPIVNVIVTLVVFSVLAIVLFPIYNWSISEDCRTLPRLYRDAHNNNELLKQDAQVASSTWKNLLATANGSPSNRTGGGIFPFLSVLESLSSADRNHVLETFYKFVFVRHPFERLVSGYNDKFYGRLHELMDKYYMALAKRLIKRYRSPTNSSSSPPYLTFSEFVRYLLDPTTPRPLNNHFRPQHELCKPCKVDYDFIGHYETLNNDTATAFILRRLGIDGLVDFRPVEPHGTSNRTAVMFAQLPSGYVEKLRQLYHLDFLLFGYDPFKYGS